MRRRQIHTSAIPIAGSLALVRDRKDRDTRRESFENNLVWERVDRELARIGIVDAKHRPASVRKVFEQPERL